MSTSTVDIDRRPNFCMNRPVWSISTDFWVLWIEPTVDIDRNSPQVESNRQSISTVTNRPVGKVQPTEPTTPVEFSSRAVFFETRKPSVKRKVKHSLNPYSLSLSNRQIDCKQLVQVVVQAIDRNGRGVYTVQLGSHDTLGGSSRQPGRDLLCQGYSAPQTGAQ